MVGVNGYAGVARELAMSRRFMSRRFLFSTTICLAAVSSAALDQASARTGGTGFAGDRTAHAASLGARVSAVGGLAHAPLQPAQSAPGLVRTGARFPHLQERTVAGVSSKP